MHSFEDQLIRFKRIILRYIPRHNLTVTLNQVPHIFNNSIMIALYLNLLHCGHFYTLHKLFLSEFIFINLFFLSYK